MEKISQAEQKEKDWAIYKKKDTRPACDQIAHILRSIYWQPNHLKHWKKQKPPPIKTNK